MSKLFTSVAGGWLLRRGLEFTGWIGTILAAYNLLPPDAKETIATLLQGNWGEITLASLVPLVLGIGGYAWSFITTIKPQVVTTDGKKVELDTTFSKSQADRLAEAEKLAKPPLLERLFRRR